MRTTQKMCRLCLQEASTLSPIFSEESHISSKIMACTNVKISNNDGYPLHICVTCTRRLNDAFEFKRQCENSDALLRQSNDNLLKYINVDDQFEVIYDSSCIKIESSEDDNSNHSSSELYLQQNYEEIKDEPYENVEKLEEEYSLEETVIYAQQQTDDLQRHITKRNINKEHEKKGRVQRRTRLHRCFFCGVTKDSLNELKTHKATHLPPYKCRYCDRELLTLIAQVSHEKTHQGENPGTVCKICGLTFIKHSGLLRHLTTHTGSTRVECETCCKMFSTKTSLRRHQLIHKGIRPFPCPVCGKPFSQSGDLKVHMDMHLDPDKPHMCDICGFTTQRIMSLKKHKVLIHNAVDRIIKPSRCEECDLKFNSRLAYKHHMKYEHLQPMKRNHLCGYCGQAFLTKHNLESHELIHTGEKPFSCPFCEKSFRQKPVLQGHIRTHTRVNSYSNKKILSEN